MAILLDKKSGRFRVSVKSGKLRRTKLLPKAISREDAELINQQMMADACTLTMLPGVTAWAGYVSRARNTPNSWFQNMLKGAKQRSKKYGRNFAIDADTLEGICLRSGGYCEVTGIAFSEETAGRSKMRPLIPSLDRRDATAGYTADNIQLVCAAVNVAMFNWGEDLFRRIAAGYVVNRLIGPTLPQGLPALGKISGTGKL